MIMENVVHILLITKYQTRHKQAVRQSTICWR